MTDFETSDGKIIIESERKSKTPIIDTGLMGKPEDLIWIDGEPT
jgi:hypothetical protein